MRGEVCPWCLLSPVEHVGLTQHTVSPASPQGRYVRAPSPSRLVFVRGKTNGFQSDARFADPEPSLCTLCAFFLSLQMTEYGWCVSWHLKSWWFLSSCCLQSYSKHGKKNQTQEWNCKWLRLKKTLPLRKMYRTYLKSYDEFIVISCD